MSASTPEETDGALTINLLASLREIKRHGLYGEPHAAIATVTLHDSVNQQTWADIPVTHVADQLSKCQYYRMEIKLRPVALDQTQRTKPQPIMQNEQKPDPVDSTARIVQVIETTHLRGRGRTTEDPVRRVTQYRTLDGQLLAEVDPCPDAGKHDEKIQGIAVPTPVRSEPALNAYPCPDGTELQILNRLTGRLQEYYPFLGIKLIPAADPDAYELVAGGVGYKIVGELRFPALQKAYHDAECKCDVAVQDLMELMRPRLQSLKPDLEPHAETNQAASDK